MESKILIDINYSTREPQILIHHVQRSDDPRDKLITMLVGQAMPGVRDGYCRIERSQANDKFEVVVITPLDPGEAVKHIPLIKEQAIQNECTDTGGVKEKVYGQDLEAVNVLCKNNLPPDVLAKWREVRQILKQTLLKQYPQSLGAELNDNLLEK